MCSVLPERPEHLRSVSSQKPLLKTLAWPHSISLSDRERQVSSILLTLLLWETATEWKQVSMCASERERAWTLVWLTLVRLTCYDEFCSPVSVEFYSVSFNSTRFDLIRFYWKTHYFVKRRWQKAVFKMWLSAGQCFTATWCDVKGRQSMKSILG